jgi:flagellin
MSGGRWNSGNAFDYTSITVGKATAATAEVSAKGNSFSGKITINGTSYDLGSTPVDLEGLNTQIQSSGYTATKQGDKLVFTNGSTGAVNVPQTIDTSTLTDGGKALGHATVAQGTEATLTLADAKGHTLKSINAITNGDGTNSYVFSNGLIVKATDKAGELTGAYINGKSGVSTRGVDLQFQIGANQGQTTTVSIQSTAADQIGLNAGTYVDANGAKQLVEADSVSDINVTTFKGAQDAITVIDKAISDISGIRAGLGAFQTNILQSNANSLNVSSQNLSSSKSTITDADLASTVVAYTKDSILVQSATSALSYANQLPQQVLKLLQ